MTTKTMDKIDLEVIIREHDLEKSDLQDFENINSIGLDTETTGLKADECDLHLIQIATDKKIFVIKAPDEESKNVISVLSLENVVKIIHYAIFDCSFLFKHLGMDRIPNIFCTKIAAKLVDAKGYYGLGKVVEKYLGVTLDKKQIQEARVPGGGYNWLNLTNKQLEYAANDVRYLRPLAVNLTHLLKQMPDLGGRKMTDIARSLFNGVNGLAHIQAYGIREDIYRHR